MVASRVAIAALIFPLTLSTPSFASQSGAPVNASNTPVSRSNVRSILPVQIRLPEKIHLIADGQVRTIKSTAVTVRDVVKEARLVLGPLDRISVPLAAGTYPGLQIRITRIKQATSIKRIRIPYVTRKISNRKMLVGKRIVKSRGIVGLAEVRALTTFADGKVVKTRVLSRLVLKPAQAALVIVGIRPRSIDELNWAAVANCESRGNPRSSNSANGYFGMYQFTLTAWKTAGGVGNPMDAPAVEQLMRAKRLYKLRGWHPWPTCGRLLWK